MSKLYFTSDCHFGHSNILKYCGRTLFMTKKDKEKYAQYLTQSEDEQKKFKISDKSLNNMNEGIIKRWNSRVKPEDIVIHNGDFCFKNSQDRGEGINKKAIVWEERLNGKIIFIRGNHDKNNSCKTKIYSMQIKMGGEYIHIVHDPMFANIKYEMNITGHVHEKWECKRIAQGEDFTDCVNCGMDVWSFYPVTYSELRGRLHKWRNKNLLSL